MSERIKIIAKAINLAEYPYRIWDNGDVELLDLYSDSWSLENRYDNTDLWKENIKKLIPGKRYVFMNFGGKLPFERCFAEAVPEDYARVVVEVYGFGPIKCPECNSENIKNSRCLDCGEWL